MSEQNRNYQKHIVFTSELARTLPPDQPYIEYISFADWTAGHHQMMHKHADIAEVLLVLRGHGRYSIGLHRREVEGGDVILCSCGEPHDEFPTSGETYQTLCLGVRRLAFPGLAPGALIAPDRDPVFRNPAQFEELFSLFQIMEAHASVKTPDNRMLCQHLTLAALELVRQMTSDAKQPPAQEEGPLLTRVERYLDAHYAEDISMDRLGQLFYVSPYHLAHLFKQNTGYTIKQYILRRRIGEAQSLLYDTTDSIASIASAVGFDDPAYFSRLFAKYVGMPPSEYRLYCAKR